MANGPVPSKAEFLLRCAKPDAFIAVSDDAINTALEDETDVAASYYGDRATLPLLTVDGAFTKAVCKLAARTLMGSRGYKKDAGADGEFIAQAKDAEAWLVLVSEKKVHPTFTDSSSDVEDAPLLKTSAKSDTWIKKVGVCGCP